MGKNLKQSPVNVIHVTFKVWSKAMPWLRRLVSGLSPRRPEFVGFVVDRVTLGQVFPCQCHSTVAVRARISPWGWTVGLLVAAVQRRRLAPSPWVWTRCEVWPGLMWPATGTSSMLLIVPTVSIAPGPRASRPNKRRSSVLVTYRRGVLSWRPLRGAAWSGAGVGVSRRISVLTVAVNWGLIYNRYTFVERLSDFILIALPVWFQDSKWHHITDTAFCFVFIWYVWNISPLTERFFMKFGINVHCSHYTCRGLYYRELTLFWHFRQALGLSLSPVWYVLR
jgi:hypothetical protein